MENKEQYLESISEIRSIMERSSRFLSLSGLSGVAAGCTALLAGAVVFMHNESGAGLIFTDSDFGLFDTVPNENLVFYIVLAAVTLFLAVVFAFFFTWKKSKKESLPIWDKTAKLLTIDMMVPLAAGGIFLLIQIFYYNIVSLAAPTMLIFYGLALFSAGKYTVKATRYFGIAELFLGIMSLIWYGAGLLFWITGFGLLHIIYGIVVYLKYDRKQY